MPATTPLGIHYPVSADAPNEALGMSTMATDIDTLITQDRAVQIISESGFVDITPVANSFTAVTVTFTSGLFPTTPNIQLTAVLAGSGTVSALGLNGNPTNTGCSIGITRTNTTVTRVYWLATITP